MNRCFVIITGYYEWNKKKQPYVFHKTDMSIMFIAGLYNEKGVVILTRDAC